MAYELKGRTHDAVSINGGGAVSNVELEVHHLERITLFALLAATVTAGDLVVTVRPFDDRGVVVDQALGAEDSVAAAAVGADVRLQQSYELRGVDRIQVRVQNNNAGAKDATVNWHGEEPA